MLRVYAATCYGESMFTTKVVCGVMNAVQAISASKSIVRP